MRSPNMSSATPAVRMMLNPRSARSRSSPRQKEVAAGLRVEAWGPVAIASRIVASGQRGTSAEQPCVAYSWSNSIAGWGVPAGGADRVWCRFLRKNVSRRGACCISAAVAMTRARRGSFGGAVAVCAEPGGAVPGSTQGYTRQGAVAAFEAGLVDVAADGVGTALPGSTQGENGQVAAAASEAGLVAASVEPGSRETVHGAAAAFETGPVSAAAEGAGTATRTSSGGAGAGHSLLGPSVEGWAGVSWV